MTATLPILGQAPAAEEDPLDLMDEIERRKKDQDATILAHFDADGDIQDVADSTGDRLKLARDAMKVTTLTIVFINTVGGVSVRRVPAVRHGGKLA